ncbi:MAG: LacI family transcriptional regulator [Spartobacteria bacterium]|nr:LacI family transcriptional regulator [Spartobacteria bacterium]
MANKADTQTGGALSSATGLFLKGSISALTGRIPLGKKERKRYIRGPENIIESTLYEHTIKDRTKVTQVKQTKRLNLVEIARLAGTSKSTVSRVLQDQPRVSPKTRARVKEVIKKYNYEPSMFARGMTGAQTGLIAVLARWMESGFFADVIRGIDDAVKKKGGFLLCSFAEEHEEYVRLWRTLTGRGQADGVIMIAPSMDLFKEPFNPYDKPVVLCASRVPEDAAEGWDAVSAVTTDNVGAMRTLVTALADAGYRDMVHIAGLPDNVDAQQRKSGFLSAVVSHPGVQGCVIDGACTSEQGYGLMNDYLDAHTGLPDIFVCFNDSVAFGALRALRERGRRVPEEVGITGWDDEVVANDISLTTVHMPVAELGKASAEALFDSVERKSGAASGKVTMIETPICVRSTTRPL